MSPDPRVQRFLAILAAGNPPNALDTTVAERRKALADLMAFGALEVPIGQVEHRSIPGPACALPVRMYTPDHASTRLMPGLLYLHGGGLVAGSVATHDAIARALANAGACRIVSLDYRLAPEHRFPAALEDSLAAIQHLAANAAEFEIDPTRLWRLRRFSRRHPCGRRLSGAHKAQEVRGSHCSCCSSDSRL